MAKNRETLDALLCEILGSENVYFQAPENMKMHYPCIRYEKSDINTKKADDRDYLKFNRYTVTLIHRDPDNTIVDALQELPYCDFDRFFVSENLNHYVFTLYY